MSIDLTSIENKARRMRSAIESIPREELPSTMSDFPKGACDAALLLGAYFADCGIEGFVYVFGRRHFRDEHAWLARGTLVVDITADQFWDAPETIIVADPSRWHNQFSTEDEPLPSDFRDWNPQGLHKLHGLYARIRSDLFSSSVE